MMTIMERLQAVSSTLSPQALAQLLDFAEFLQLKNPVSTSLSSLPLSALAGGLEQSSTFAASPVNIQESLRREWD